LFQYKEAEVVRSISASDVNAYLSELSDSAITSKDFRTWGGTVCALVHLDRAGMGETKSVRRANIRKAILSASRLLGNTVAVCRDSYIHPAVLSTYEAGVEIAPAQVQGLRKSERLALGMLASWDRGQRRSRNSNRDASVKDSRPCAAP